MRTPPLWLALAHVLLHANAQQLPYNPTSIFLAPNNEQAYILLPPSSSAPAGELLALNISSRIDVAKLSPTVLSKSLPFLEGSNDGIAYVPAMKPSGDIGVYAGSCASNSSVWTYSSGSAKPGKWSETAVSDSAATTSSELHNTNFLAAGLYFSTKPEADAANTPMFVLGGMCPTVANTNASTWQASANYTNSLLKLTPPKSTGSAAPYTVSLGAADGQKLVPEAGHTITSLAPTLANASSSAGADYVLIGGHTAGAFIGMDRVGVLALPEGTWTFQSVSARAFLGGGELAVIRASGGGMPDSRSGHTALLSGDGGRIVVFGGWVGDVNTPAEPQLLVLQLGGDGEWSWEVPKAAGSGLGGGEGIYGHGAVMLPGGVMMVVGGHTISSAPSKEKRADSKFQTLLLDTTTMAWVNNYTNPSFSSPNPTATAGTTDPAAPSGDDNSRKVKIGVGAGIGGVVAIAIAVLCIWYARRAHAKRVGERHQKLHALSQAAHCEGRDSFYGPYNGEMVQRQNSQNLGNRSMSVGGGNAGGAAYEALSYGGYDYEDDGNLSYVVPAQRSSFTIPRKPTSSRNARGYSQPPLVSTNQYSSFDFGTNHTRANSLGTAGTIHPIYEADEDNDIADAGLLNVGQAVEYPPSSSNDHSDPFTEPHQVSTGDIHPYQLHPPANPNSLDRNTPSPDSPAKEREREVDEWVADWAAADALMRSHSRSQSLTQSGRLSPSKESTSGRTASNLSEQSAVTLSRSGSQATRSNSLTAFFTGGAAGWNPFASSGAAGPTSGTVARRVEYVHGGYGPSSGRVTAEGYYTNGSISPTSDRSGGTLTAPPPRSAGSGSISGGSASFVTAQSGGSFPALRVEAESLLPRPGEWESGSPSKSKGLKKPPGWLGSLKKVFGQEEWVSGPGVDEAERYVDSPSPTRAAFGSEPYRDDDTVPRRAASAGSMLWRRKQGRGDWEDSADEGTVGPRPYSVAGLETAPPGEEEEWDVEKAVRGRVVQVMFTVPKERLRVVNQDEGVEDDESDIGMQREGSPTREGRDEEGRMATPEQEDGRASPLTPIKRIASPQTPSNKAAPDTHLSSRSTSPAKSLRGKRVQEIVDQMERRGSM
ncbi:hypothetical protein V499_07601 [Pseudogymnoascus sp. VKM F-103]|uniref:Galactose oxidase n=1 Tax=Pseudogymnoascus verrucosus TaxID=342668 RepID=A0A1B8GHI3_9PEZI|nr:uncharacterized protein VE01_07664 [Pseudogymnoascus verrucosus]KFY72248.1 hypothetical protein V499_07601 [Pseudogymnoascus sp. VKM F-103]OBT95274.1 hypothetical protein VE01_07664 [Pseudogymnoascus verrucosus]